MDLHNEAPVQSALPRNRWSSFFHAVWNGPASPRDDPPQPFTLLPRIEQFPDQFRQRVAKQYRVALLACYYTLWFGLIYSIVVPYFTLPPGNGAVAAVSLSCQGQLDWRGKNGACGLHGKLCQPPADDVIIRCPALCDRSSWTYSLVPLGDQRIKYRLFIVGGGTEPHQTVSRPYRADSYPCGAAVHAGILSPFFGGCAKVAFTGEKDGFSLATGHYGMESISFRSFFTSSYSLLKLPGQYAQCYDPRLLVLIVNIVLGLPIVYLASGAVAFWTINTVGFWTICLATDPPVSVLLSPEDFASLISIGLERFLPSCFILYVLWRCSSKRTLSEPPPELDVKRSPLSRVVFWYPMFWLGVLNNVTFDRLPVDRLTISDLKEQAGALVSVLGIVSLILTCAVIQAYKIWLSGRFQKYLKVYLWMLAGLVAVSTIPGLTLRVHHYILALILLPGCSTRGITALLFQGLLLGLFLSGASRWGLAAIAETVIALKRDDPIGKVLPPKMVAYDAGSGVLSWENAVRNLTKQEEKLYQKYSSVSLLINDIEQYVGEKTNSVDLKKLFGSEELAPKISHALKGNFTDENGDISIYLRIGRKIKKGSVYSDFSNSAVLKWPSGNITLPEDGLT
ncbi:uncharacterized protein CANTADRAFT_52196 [Suhomyces tanzawaensis NRRL Y-17324]|uniref:LCCL domain-containing protein n=1 Tax=Suhomyces tanzawaensis NRRL Y-17324 TaxID=984487 RepID=A0A1E4SHE2_9ASCO|nr:uncharacterized protein CANTADRAFT_52196 [Suhomyces tanzawaensis NRRL Y-17324]ODV78928.1 hypothetical protein CANTADRAFT_52196 [Suhomyces tanzawaensis NRRL Y-17324]